MGLNKTKGNMYDFIDYTFNICKGSCIHDCKYCYMKRWKSLNTVRFDEKELKTDLGSGNIIFVGSSTDMFAPNIPNDWIIRILNYLKEFDNRYFFQTKNPAKFRRFLKFMPRYIFCTTLESNRHYPDIMRQSPDINKRVFFTKKIKAPIFITIEPLLDFDLQEFLMTLKSINPVQVNIGADSGGHKLPEPPKEKILKLIEGLEKFTKVNQKSNLKRLLK